MKYNYILPQGYQFRNALETNDMKYITFIDESNNKRGLVQGNISANMQLDSEDGNTIEIDVKGNKGLIIEKGSLIIISWHNNEKSFCVQGNVDRSILLELAESTEKYK